MLGKISLVIEWWMHEMRCLSMWLMQKLNSFKARLEKFYHKYKLNNLMPRIVNHLEAVCLQVNLMSTSAEIKQLKYTVVLNTALTAFTALTDRVYRVD